MIYFDFREIVSSVLHSLIYGAFFSVFSLTFLVLKGFLGSAFRALCQIFVYNGSLFKTEWRGGKGWGAKFSSVSAFLFTVMFSLGFIFLSYYSIDGQIRVYMLLIAVSVFLLVRFLFENRLRAIICRLFELVLSIFIIISRIILLPFRNFVFLFYKKRKQTNTSIKLT